MYQIDNATAATVEPTPGAVGPHPNGFFTVGNPGTGTPATIVDADWLNAVQDEIINAVAGAGLTPTKGTNTQLLATIRALASKAHGQCQLQFVSSTQIKLAPRNGSGIVIGGQGFSIPSGGITAANTGVFVNGVAGQNLVANTLYWVYLFNNSGTLTIDFSTTSHATDTTAGNVGVEIKSGDNTRTLVGLIATAPAATTFSDTDGARNVLSWFNRRQRKSRTQFSTGRTQSNTSFLEIHTEIRNTFLTWAEEDVGWFINGFLTDTAASAAGTACAFDSATAAEPDNVQQQVSGAGAFATACCASRKSGLTEGQHFATVLGFVSVNTGTWQAGTGLSITVNG